MLRNQQIQELKIKYDYTEVNLEDLERKNIHQRTINYIYPNFENTQNRIEKALIPEQQKELENFYKFLLSGGSRAKKPLSFLNIIRHLYYVGLKIKKPYSLWKRKDLENYFADLFTKSKSSSTIGTRKVVVKQFFKWFTGKEKPEITSWYNATTGKKQTLNPADLITPIEIKEIVSACDNKRDTALFMTIYEGALRVSEARYIKIKDIKKVENGLLIQVTGKTGSRNLLFMDSVPFILSWLNEHPQKDNLNAILFPTINHIKFGSPIYKEEISRLLKIAVSRTKIKKKVWPHLLRHSRLTYLAQYCGFSEMDLKIFAGWTKDSNMSAVYLHLDENHVYNKLLEHKGLLSEEYLKKQKEQDKSLEPKICPSCKKSNPVTNLYCSCGELLDIEGKDRQTKKEFDTVMEGFMQSKFADEFKEIFKEFLENKTKGE